MSENPERDPLDPKRYVKAAPRPPEGELDLRALFEPAAPIELDIGFGRGLSLFARAERAPQARILGVEVKAKCVVQAAQKIEARGLGDRICVWAADVRTLLPRTLEAPMIQRAFVHFPDPWWKERHQKRMVVTTPFLDALCARLVEGGEIFVQTDVSERHEAYYELCAAHPLLGAPTILEENTFGATSNRERRAIEDGLPIHRFVVSKR